MKMKTIQINAFFFSSSVEPSIVVVYSTGTHYRRVNATNNRNVTNGKHYENGNNRLPCKYAIILPSSTWLWCNLRRKKKNKNKKCHCTCVQGFIGLYSPISNNIVIIIIITPTRLNNRIFSVSGNVNENENEKY